MGVGSFAGLSPLAPRTGGLTDAEVASQRVTHGNNEIVEVAGNPWWELAKDTFKDPMIWFLLLIGSLFVGMGEVGEGVVLFVAMVPLVGMDVVLHWRTQASTSGLRGQLASRVQVIREGGERTIDARELVPGDLMSVGPGFFLPADGIFQAATEVQVDESVLTGEAFPIPKQAASIDPFVQGTSPASTLGFAGTRVLTGKGLLRVLFTGARTTYGEIVQSAARMPSERTPLQRSIATLVQRLIVASLVLCVVLAGVRLAQGHGWMDALISAATLAIAAIPEEFPVVFTFYLGVGVYRLARKRALVRRAVSVENIGRVTQICTDKTGTITVGRLTLAHRETSKTCSEADLLRVAMAASDPLGMDPVDVAIHALGKAEGEEAPTRLRVFPFTEDRKCETALVDGPSGRIAYTKGAPETVFGKSLLSEAERSEWAERTARWAREGHKMLACARVAVPAGSEVEPDRGFEFCGLLAFEDPARPEVADAVKACREHGIRVLMITGDHPDTGAAIARDVGLGGASPRVISAEEHREQFEEDSLRTHPDFLKGLDVVARCTPLQKLRIVVALKAAGELVAVTGDGVNDVPALKAADIGIAMGERGSRSAKEVSSIVLADDNFRTIAEAVLEGRQLFANLRMSFEYLLLIHLPLVLTAAILPLFGYPLLYLPAHIVWLELMIHPTALFAFQEMPAKEGSQRPPRSFFARSDVVRVIALGLGVTLALGAAFVLVLRSSEEEHARAMALALLTLWSAASVVALSRLRTRGAWGIAIGTVLASVLLIQFPFLSRLLHLRPLHGMDWGAVLAVAGGLGLITYVGRRYAN